MRRRSFLFQSAALGTTAAVLPGSRLRGANAAANKVKVAVVALGRGLGHVQALLKIPGVEIDWLAEVDPKRLDTGLKLVSKSQSAVCRGVKDFRSFLDDPTLDAVFIATPNFWHTPAALLCLQAGKHVYVEKPGSQNAREAEMIVEASIKSDRLVQMGNQRRTWMKDAVEALHAGAIGTVRFGRAFYYNNRKAIGLGEHPASADLDFNLWQGPVPDDAAHDLKRFTHYDWHWLWHWGNGELGNNGVHTLDILRWGLKADYPLSVTYQGGRYGHEDPQETPDTGTAVYDFGHAGCEWVQSSCHPRAAEKPAAECVFYGEHGSMGIDRDSWKIYDPKGMEISTGKASTAGTGDVSHIANFIEAIRGDTKLNSPINEGQKSTMMCHLGNLAYRTNTVIRCDPQSGKMMENPGAMKWWGRESYRKGWEVKV